MITLSHIHFSYTGRAPWVLDDISLFVPKGTYISILGENGCGKSTLMRLMLGFLKPVSGTVSLGARRIGYVPQRSDFNNVDFPITVREMMDAYRHLLHINDPAATAHALSLTETADLAPRLMGTLSGGQRQRVLIARALLGCPDLLLLDEPSTGVDSRSQKEIYALLAALHQKQGMTILSIEHNLPAALALSDALFCMDHGHGTILPPEDYPQRRKKESISHV